MRAKNAKSEPPQTVGGNAAVVPFVPHEKSIAAVGIVAKRLEISEERMRGWMEHADRMLGAGAAKKLMNYFAGLMQGERVKPLIRNCGLTPGEIVLVAESDSAFNKMIFEVNRLHTRIWEMERAAMGEEVLDAAYSLATRGEKVLNRAGEVVGYKRSEKMLDRLLVMSGPEFRKDGGGVVVAGAGGDKPSVALTFNFGGGKTENMGVVNV